MKKKIFTLILSFWLPNLCFAEDSHDDEIFGNTEAKPEIQKSSLNDTLQIGGRLEIRMSSAQEEEQKFPQSSFSQIKRADLYFDVRPLTNLRSLLRLRFSEAKPQSITPAVGNTFSQNALKTEIDELWFKWTAYETAFFTVGKQHLKWGSSTFWNPTDFTAVTNRDPLALFDSRLGQELIKIHIPNEKYGFNYYVIFQFDRMTKNNQLGTALRGEFAFAGVGEAAVSFQTQKNQPVRWGLDVSGGVGPFDLYTEAAMSQNEPRQFFTGAIDAENGMLPTASLREKNTFFQITVGVRYVLKYGESDQLTVGAEYFENGLGYDNRELELYSLVMQQSQPLYVGKHYTGGYVQVPAPGSWNDTNFFLNAMHNLSDSTTMARLSVTTKVYKELTLEGFVGQCFGDYGELCFRITPNIQRLSSQSTLPPAQQQIIAALPTRRTKTTLGLALNMSF